MDNADQPLFRQIAALVEDSIVDGVLKAGDRAPSTNELADFHDINPATARKGLNLLVDGGVLEKRRGLGMFVTAAAAEQGTTTAADLLAKVEERHARLDQLRAEPPTRAAAAVQHADAVTALVAQVGADADAAAAGQATDAAQDVRAVETGLTRLPGAGGAGGGTSALSLAPMARTEARSVARLTEASITPGTAFSARSTRATQEAQVMPAILRSTTSSAGS